MVKISIIGHYREDLKNKCLLNSFIYDRIVSKVKVLLSTLDIPLNEIDLLCRGSPWCDFIPITLFKSHLKNIDPINQFHSLVIYSPCEWNYRDKCYKEENISIQTINKNQNTINTSTTHSNDMHVPYQQSIQQQQQQQLQQYKQYQQQQDYSHYVDRVINFGLLLNNHFTSFNSKLMDNGLLTIHNLLIKQSDRFSIHINKFQSFHERNLQLMKDSDIFIVIP
jgi:hypothetical protein